MEARALQALQAALPAYEVGSELGRGAFGVVYAAHHTQLGRDVAIKVLPQVFATDGTVRERFVDEAKVVASLEHPHIVPVYDYVEDEHACMLIMERCAASVGDRFKDRGIATDEACAAVLACLAALDLAHARGVLHRDVKPENLMLDAKGVVKLADFGIARALDTEVRHTKTGMIIGTPAYMSPEQVRGDELGAASDVYSVAVMAYELLAGTLPFPATPSALELLTHHLSTQPLPLVSARPELPGAVGAVVDQALSKSLEERPDSAADFASELSKACVRSFGSGWLRRRGFTLHWPDMVAENERPSSGSAVGSTDTITVQALSEPHEVLGPDDAFARWNDTLLERAVDPETTRPNVSQPPPPTPGTLRPTQPSQPSPPAAPRAHTSPPPPNERSSETGGRKTAIWTLCGLATVLLVAIAGFLLLTRDDATDQQPVSDDADTVPTEGSAPQTTSAGAVGEATQSPVTVTPNTVAEAEPESEAENADPMPRSDRPETYDATDASDPMLPTPCPDGQERVACIHSGVTVDEAGILSLDFFTEGFMPGLAAGEHRVHFFLDTEVDGDEIAAGSTSPVGMYKAWGQPFEITTSQAADGGEMFTLSDAEAADARYLCIIVADPDGGAIPQSGNCAPIFQAWDPATLDRQSARIPGVYIGRCAARVTAVVPTNWSAADLGLESPAEVADRIFASDDAAESFLQNVVDGGGVLYAAGPNTDGGQVDLTVTILDGDYRIGSNPTQVVAELSANGITLADTDSEVIGGRLVPTSTTRNDTDATKRYYISDFGYVIELVFVLDAEAPTDIADRIADTVLGC